MKNMIETIVRISDCLWSVSTEHIFFITPPLKIGEWHGYQQLGSWIIKLYPRQSTRWSYAKWCPRATNWLIRSLIIVISTMMVVTLLITCVNSHCGGFISRISLFLLDINPRLKLHPSTGLLHGWVELPQHQAGTAATMLNDWFRVGWGLVSDGQ